MWDWNFAFSVFPDILKASIISIEAAILGYGFGLLVGLILALLRLCRFTLVTRIVSFLIQFIRSTPLLVQLYFLFFVLPYYGIKLNAFTVGVIGLGINYGAFIAEILRAGIQAVPHSQWDAVICLNFSSFRAWTLIILPQAIRSMIPALTNRLIMMFKETALLAAITIQEMLLTAKTIGSYSFRYIEPFTIVGLIYLVLSYLSSLFLQRLEVKK